MGHKGIGKLQNKLSRDILGGQYTISCNFDDEFSEIIPRFRDKSILLILDDVDEVSQLKQLVGNRPEDILGTGSRVIITTRDKSVCNGFVQLGSKAVYFYEMEKMDDNRALQLFSKHTFGTSEPPKDFLSLSKAVVETTGNLPLALEVIAGHLCCQSKESWKHTLEKLNNVPPKKVFEILRVSYEGLDFSEKEIFLDIACFQPDMPRRYAGYLWEARDLYPKCGVMVLINKSLIKIDSGGDFWIHDQLRDMGRHIIRSEGQGRPELCTRLWNPDDALKIVLQKKVSEKIIAMKMGREYEAHNISDENFRGLSNLQYLCLNWTQLTGDVENLGERLIWLSWIGCINPTSSNFFKMSNLVVLQITRVWGCSVEKLIMPQLRVLEIRHNYTTTKTPDVSGCLKLESMVFEHFYKLKEIHYSVGKLQSLTYMKISGCQSLRSLPKELCCARALQELVVSRNKIEEVPESIGRLESLRTLNLQHNNIRRLPASICNLKNLLVLDAEGNPLDEGIPEEIGSLSVLEYLNLSGSKIHSLPATVTRLSGLESLILRDCDLIEELPGLPTSLTKLTLSSKSLRAVPNMAVLTSITEINTSDGTYRTKDYEGERVEEVYGLESLELCPSRMNTFSRASELGSVSRLETLEMSYNEYERKSRSSKRRCLGE